MKSPSFQLLLPILLSMSFVIQGLAQQAGMNKIDIPDLESHLKILAADDMEGRATGEAGLDKAAEYLAAEAEKAGLIPVDENADYFQEYTLVRKSLDSENSFINISTGDAAEKKMNYPLFLMNPDSDKIELSGDVVFAGYGIVSQKDNYNDLENLDISGKILLIMNRGPLSENGNENLLSNQNWKNFRSFQYKLPTLVRKMPRAILIVPDPKSGYTSLDEFSPRMARYFNSSRYVKELGERNNGMVPGLNTKLIFIHREVADELLKSSGKNLAELQESIDTALVPQSFDIPDTEIEVMASYVLNEKSVPNVVGIIEGKDPELKKEVIIYTAHFDHLGTNSQGEVYNGADDNASGTTALIELAQAFKAEQENLKRSVMMLWVSGEEIGLYGSKYYSKYPIFPLDNTVANLNLDMIGSVRTERDNGKIYGEKVSVLGMDSIGLIGGHQSSDLMKIHNEITASLGMYTDSSLNDPDHPYRYYYRSDHFNFAKNDVPVLFYSTGIHVDYHKLTDNYERINYTKLKKVTELSFLVGYKLATMPARIEEDNPYSGW